MNTAPRGFNLAKVPPMQAGREEIHHTWKVKWTLASDYSGVYINSLNFIFLKRILKMRVCRFAHARVCACVPGGQKRVSYPLKLELQAFAGHTCLAVHGCWDPICGLHDRAVRALNHWAAYPHRSLGTAFLEMSSFKILGATIPLQGVHP